MRAERFEANEYKKWLIKALLLDERPQIKTFLCISTNSWIPKVKKKWQKYEWITLKKITSQVLHPFSISYELEVHDDPYSEYEIPSWSISPVKIRRLFTEMYNELWEGCQEFKQDLTNQGWPGGLVFAVMVEVSPLEYYLEKLSKEVKKQQRLIRRRK